MDLLKNLLIELNDLKSHKYENYKSVFDKYAEDLMLGHFFKYEENKYNITEIEFYYFHKDHHPDPYSHTHKQQRECGTLYFHGSGFDITFGDDNSYGGILIRGIKDENKYYDGPILLIEKLFNVKKYKANDVRIEGILLKDILVKEDKTDEQIYHSTRVGLQPHPLDYELFVKEKTEMPYIFRHYRYIKDKSTEHKYKDKEKINFYDHLKDSSSKRPKYSQDTNPS